MRTREPRYTKGTTLNDYERGRDEGLIVGLIAGMLVIIAIVALIRPDVFIYLFGG